MAGMFLYSLLATGFLWEQISPTDITHGYYQSSTFGSLIHSQYCILFEVNGIRKVSNITCGSICNNAMSCHFFTILKANCIACYGVPFPESGAEMTYNEFPGQLDTGQQVYVHQIAFPQRYVIADGALEWQTARDVCVRVNGDLVAIESSAELQTIQNLIVASDLSATCSRMWTVGRKIGSTWYWGETSTTISIWGHGLPDGDADGVPGYPRLPGGRQAGAR